MPKSSRYDCVKNVLDFSNVNDEDKRDSRSAGELYPYSDTPTLIALHSLKSVMTDGESYFSMHAAYKIEPRFTSIPISRTDQL